jgi:hypothetical protein
MGVIFKRLGATSAMGAELSKEARLLYDTELSVYVHRLSHGTIWDSTGPIYVPSALEIWYDQYVRTYRVLCNLIDAVTGVRAAAIADRTLAT